MLTENGVVTADSVYSGPEANISNCISHLVDGVFFPEGLSLNTHCVAHSNGTGPDEWFNIEFKEWPTTVFTVIVINHENDNPSHNA